MHRPVLLLLALVAAPAPAAAQSPPMGTQVLTDLSGDLQATVDGAGVTQPWPVDDHRHLDLEGVWLRLDPDRGLQVTLDLLDLQDGDAKPLEAGWGQLDLRVAGEPFGLYVWLTPGNVLDGDGQSTAYTAHVLHEGRWVGGFLEAAVEPSEARFVTWVPLHLVDAGGVMAPGADVEVAVSAMATWDHYQGLRIHDEALGEGASSVFRFQVPGADTEPAPEPTLRASGREAPGLAWSWALLAVAIVVRRARLTPCDG